MRLTMRKKRMRRWGLRARVPTADCCCTIQYDKSIATRFPCNHSSPLSCFTGLSSSQNPPPTPILSLDSPNPPPLIFLLQEKYQSKPHHVTNMDAWIGHSSWKRKQMVYCNSTASIHNVRKLCHNVPAYEVTATLTPLQATIKVTCKILRLLSTLRC